MTYIDIETVSRFPDYESADVRTQELFHQKMIMEPSIQSVPMIDGLRDTREAISKLYEQKAALFAEFNQVVCVSFGAVMPRKAQMDGSVSDEYIALMSIINTDEHQLLLDVAESLKKSHSLCAHYGKGFDFPVLSRKFIIHGIPIPALLDNSSKKPWEIPLVDTADLWKFGDLRHSASLDLLTHCFGLPSPKEGMHGADVGRVYHSEGESSLIKIARYCEGDVRALINVHRRINGQPAIL